MGRFLLLISFFCAFLSYSQDVELVVSTEFEYSQANCISHDNRLLSRLYMNKLSVWDVATGRMIRSVVYTDDQSFVGDSIWFSDDNKHVIVGGSYHHNQYSVNVVTGESEYIQGKEFDYSTYVYKNSSLAIASTFLVNDQKTISFFSPDNKKELILLKIKNRNDMTGMLPWMINLSVKTPQRTVPLDSSFYCYFCFSPDSKYLYLNGSIVNLESGHVVSKLHISPFSGKGLAFVPGTHIPVTCGTKSIRIWDFPNVVDLPLDYMIDFKAAPGYRFAVAEQVNDKNKKKVYSVVDIEKRKVISSFTGTDFMAYLNDVDKDASRIILNFYEYGKDPADYGWADGIRPRREEDVAGGRRARGARRAQREDRLQDPRGAAREDSVHAGDRPERGRGGKSGRP